MRPDKLVSLHQLVDRGTQGDRVDAEILIVLEGKGVLNDHGSRLKEGVKHVQVVSLDLLVDLLVIMLKLVSEDVENFEKPVDSNRTATVDEAFEELHHVLVEKFMVAFSRDDLLQIVVPLVEAILEVVADAVQQVVVDEVAVERLRSCALLGGSVKVRISLLDSDVALSEQVLLDGIDDHVRLKAQRKQKLDDLLAALVDVHTYFIEILAPAPD